MAKIDTKTIFAIGGGIALLALLAKATIDRIIDNIIIDIGTPQLDSTPFSDGFIRVDVPVIITNNNPFPINVKYFFGVVKYGNITLANVNFPIGFSIAPGMVKTINLDLDVPISTVLTDLSALLTSNTSLLDALLNKIYLSGKLQLVGNFTNVPISLDNIPIPII